MSTLPAHGYHDFGQALVECYAANERMNQIVLAHLDQVAWRDQLPGSKARTIAAIVAHVHNIRRKWLRLSAPQIALPAPLNRLSCTQREAQSALAASGARCTEMLASALSRQPGAVTSFRRDSWAKPWPAGPAMFAYMVTHEAHHRGQITMLAHQLRYPLPAKIHSDLWNWEKLWKECGSTYPR